MPIIVREEVIDCSNPELQLFTAINGTPVDMETVNWRVFDNSTGTPVQVEPVSGFNTLDISDCPTGYRLGPGNYTVPWTVPSAAAFGAWFIEWQFRQTATLPFQTHCVDFVISPVAAASQPLCYISVAEARARGVTTDFVATDQELEELIEEICTLIDTYTCRHFAPVSKTIRVDGSGTSMLQLGEEIIDINSIKIRNFSASSPDTDVDMSDVIVYNRHVTQNLMDPDDRENPKVEFDRLSLSKPGFINRFPKGTQNVIIDGTFGYTDWDGTPTGKTPLKVKKLAFLMLAERLANPPIGAPTPITCTDPNEFRVIERKTRDMTIKYEPRRQTASGTTFFSQTQEINTLIESLRKSQHMGAV